MAYYMFGYSVYNVADIRAANNMILKRFERLYDHYRVFEYTDQYKMMTPFLPLLDNRKLPFMWGTLPEYNLFDDPWFKIKTRTKKTRRRGKKNHD